MFGFANVSAINIRNFFMQNFKILTFLICLFICLLTYTLIFAEPAVALRSSVADARGTLQLGYDTDSGSEKQDRETEKYSIRRRQERYAAFFILFINY